MHRTSGLEVEKEYKVRNKFTSMKLTADGIGIRLLRREIRAIEIRLLEIQKRSEGTTDLFFVLGGHDVELKLDSKISELESLGYKHVEGWND